MNRREACMQSWIWQGLEFGLPEDWEMLQFSRNPEAGRCAFADRTQFRFELDWKRVPGRPDFDRMLSDYMNKLVGDGMKRGQLVDHNRWRGLEGEVDGQWMSRYGWFAENRSFVVECVLLWPDRKDPVLERKILDGLRESSAEADGAVHWRAFGMDVRAPAGWRLTECVVEPARAELTFADGRHKRTEAKFCRRGMVPEWLHTPVDRWLRIQAEQTFQRLSDTEKRTDRNHEKVLIRGMKRGPGLLARPRPARLEAWICPRDGRLYSLAGYGPAAAVESMKLSCGDDG